MNIEQNKINGNLPLVAVIFINLLFLIKYLQRVSTEVALVGCGLYLAGCVVCLILHKKRLGKSLICLFSAVILILVSLLFIVSLDDFQSDRWKIIKLFWDSIENGKNPYMQLTDYGNPIGAMSVYFLLFAPFHYLGEISISVFVLIFTLLFLIIRNFGRESGFRFILLVILGIPLYWETACRSTLIVNSVVFLLAFLLLDKINKEDMMSNIKIFFLIGLLLCTRTVFVLPLIVYFAYLLKRESISKVLLYGTVLVVAYLMPMLPFFAMWPNEMVSQNPYLTQGGNLIPFWSIIMLCLISLLFGFKSRNFKDVMWWSAVMLAMAGFAHILWISSIYTFPKAYFGNIADISYMLFSYVFFGYIFIESGKTNTETKFGEQTVYMG